VTAGAGFILNPFRQEDMYALADFDSKHIVNVNGIFKLPFGRGEPFLGRHQQIRRTFFSAAGS
jgi:hypothetical protein